MYTALFHHPTTIYHNIKVPHNSKPKANRLSMNSISLVNIRPFDDDHLPNFIRIYYLTFGFDGFLISFTVAFFSLCVHVRFCFRRHHRCCIYNKRIKFSCFFVVGYVRVLWSSLGGLIFYCRRQSAYWKVGTNQTPNQFLSSILIN